MNRTKTVICPVCGADSKIRKWYDGTPEHRKWSKTEAVCQECGYSYTSVFFDPYVLEVIGHVVLEREMFAADDRDHGKVEARLTRQHVERLDVLQEGRGLVASKEYRTYRLMLSSANANQDHTRKKHLEFLNANKDRFPLNLKAFRQIVKSWSKNRKGQS